MGKRTSLILEGPLLEAAERILGTKGPTATVRASLEATVRQEHLQRLAQWELPEDFPAQLEKIRQPQPRSALVE